MGARTVRGARSRATRTFDAALRVDPDAAFEKAFVRLRQASVPQKESFLALRAGAGVLQAIALGITLLAAIGCLALVRADEGEFLGVAKGYLVGGIVIGAMLLNLLLLVLADVLTLQVAVARNTRMTSVVLAELNLFVTTQANDRSGAALVTPKATEARPGVG